MSNGRLLWKAFMAENRLFMRTPVAAFFTIGLPVIMLILFVTLFGNDPVIENARTQGQEITTAQFYAPALAVFAAASATYTNIAINLTIRRDDGVLKRVRGTPIPPGIFLAGSVLSGVAIAFVATAIMMWIGWNWYGISLSPGQLPAMIVALLFGTICFSSLGLALASLSKTASGAPAIANATILPMAFISDVFVALGEPPAWLDTLGNVLPLKPFAVAFSEAMSPFRDGFVVEWDRIAVMVVWTVVGAVVTAKFFRWEPLPGASGSRRRRRSEVSA